MRPSISIVIAAAIGAGCSASSEKTIGLADAGFGGGGASSDAASGCLASNECPTGYTCNDFHVCVPPSTPPDGGTPPPPPETEYEFSAPIASQRFVYVAMTAQDALARVDGTDLGVRSTGVGKAPRVVGAIPHEDGAVVLDSYNGTATIVRPPMQSTQPDHVKVLPTLAHLNRLDLDPSGRYAVIWFDLQKALTDGGISGIGSFQDVTVVALADGHERAVNLTVGFRPRAVQFDRTGDHAYVITEDGVSAIDLGTATQAGPSIVPPIAVADPSVAVADLEVQVVATGAYATVRQAGVAALRVVALTGTDVGHAYTIPLASPPTDIDLAPDGSRVYAVLREAKRLAVIDIPGDALAPSGVETIDVSAGTIGSLALSADGRRALLYTNATLDERITMIALDRPGYPIATWPLKKAVRAVGLSPTGDSAIVLNAKIPGDPAGATSVDDYIDKSYGYTLLDLATGFGKLQITTVDPSAFVYAPDGRKAYVTLDGGDAPTSTREVQVVTVQTGVVVGKALGSPPSAVGILPGANQAFVAQRHPLGRVSFVDLGADSVRTVTGFDLNGHVVN